MKYGRYRIHRQAVLTCFERTQTAPQSLCLKDLTYMNMRFMSVTLDTSHLDMSQLRRTALLITLSMLVTLDTFHFEMSPSKFVIENI